MLECLILGIQLSHHWTTTAIIVRQTLRSQVGLVKAGFPFLRYDARTIVAFAIAFSSVGSTARMDSSGSDVRSHAVFGLGKQSHDRLMSKAPRATPMQRLLSHPKHHPILHKPIVNAYISMSAHHVVQHTGYTLKRPLILQRRYAIHPRRERRPRLEGSSDFGIQISVQEVVVRIKDAERCTQQRLCRRSLARVAVA